MALGQNSVQTNAEERDIFWGKTVLSKRLEHKHNFGGGFQFRSVAYNIDCPSGCFENPLHIGELWFRSKMIARGLSSPEYCCSLSPSKRFLLFEDGKLKLFDRVSGKVDVVADEALGERDMQKCKWDETAHRVELNPYGVQPYREIRLP
jgi:hypothetical protein